VSLGIGALDGTHEVKEALCRLDVGRWRCERRLLRCSATKNDYRGVIAGLEGVTGQKAVNLGRNDRQELDSWMCLSH